VRAARYTGSIQRPGYLNARKKPPENVSVCHSPASSVIKSILLDQQMSIGSGAKLGKRQIRKV